MKNEIRIKEILQIFNKDAPELYKKYQYLENNFKQNSVSNNDIIEIGDEVSTKDGNGIVIDIRKKDYYLVKGAHQIHNGFPEENCLIKGNYSNKNDCYYYQPYEIKLIKKASQTTNYIHEKQVDSVSPQVSTDLILIKKAKKAKEIDILPVQSPIFVNQKVNNKKQLLILN